MKCSRFCFTFLFIIFCIYPFIRCETESPLSDVELNDPSVILLEIDVEVVRTLSGEFSKSFQAIFKDKKGDYINLKNGGVSVNGYNLAVKTLDISDAPYYELVNNQVNLNSNSRYSFLVKLSSESDYIAEVRSLENQLTIFNVPTTHKKTESLTVSWQTANVNDHLQIKAIRYVKTGQGNVLPKDKTVSITSPQSGQYTFTPAYFQDVDGSVINVDFVLTSTDFGTIAGGFKPDSYIKNTYEIWKSVDVIE